MGDFRKITVEVPDEILRRAQAYTKAGITETIQTALESLVPRNAQLELLALEGKIDLGINWKEMKEDRE